MHVNNNNKCIGIYIEDLQILTKKCQILQKYKNNKKMFF